MAKRYRPRRASTPTTSRPNWLRAITPSSRDRLPTTRAKPLSPPAPIAASGIPTSKAWIIWWKELSEPFRDVGGGAHRYGRDLSRGRSRIPPALRRDHRIHPDSGRGTDRRARGVRHIRAPVRQGSARPVFLHVSGRIRNVVFLAEQPDAGRAVDSHRAVHGASGAT